MIRDLAWTGIELLYEGTWLFVRILGEKEKMCQDSISLPPLQLGQTA